MRLLLKYFYHIGRVTLNYMIEYELLELHRNTWYYIIVWRLFADGGGPSGIIAKMLNPLSSSAKCYIILQLFIYKYGFDIK